MQLFPNIGFRAEACRGTHGLPLEPNADIAGPGFVFFLYDGGGGGMDWANECRL